MAWYRTGTVTVTNGSATVTGVGTDFVSNVLAGDGFRGPDGRTSEIARVVSANELTLAEGYNGPTAGGQGYAIQPTQSYIRDLAQAAATLLATFGAVRDGIGQGLIGNGSPAAPGIRFAEDQDTGLRRYDTNAVSLVAGGVDAVTAGTAGVTLYSGATRSMIATASGVAADTGRGLHWAGTGDEILIPSDGAFGWVWQTDGRILIKSTKGVTKALFPATGGFQVPSGLLLVGTSSAATHAIQNDAQAGGGPIVLFRQGGDVTSAAIFVVDLNGVEAASSANAAMKLGKAGTGRSLNASGTLNASGADYAEYMTKAAGCGTIAPGDVCGVDQDGKLTRTWADARSFVVKSTDPAYVGGDTWAAGMPARPEAPGAEPIAPAALPARPKDDAPELDNWRELADAYPAAFAGWQTDHAAWQAASAAYDRDLPVWEAALEAERVKVDRIAFCGQVPVNVSGDFAVGDYLIAAAAGAGIKAVAIAEGDITFDQYRRRLGKVWAVRDGRAWVDVQHG